LSRTPDPQTPYFMAIFPEAFNAGMAEGFRKYGLLIDHFDSAVVGGRWYQKLVFVGEPPPGNQPPAPPTKELFDHLFQVVPELRARRENAERALKDRIWRDDVARWRDELRAS